MMHIQGIRVKVGKDGRINIPAAYRHILHLETGEEVILSIQEGTLRLCPLKQAVKHAQNIVKRFNTGCLSLTKELSKLRQEDNACE